MARRLWSGHQSVPAEMRREAIDILATLRERPGKVESAGNFSNDAFIAAICGALPMPVRDFVRPRTEWYACRGAFFHTDAHYDGVLFGVWCVAGPPRDIVFARAKVRVPGGLHQLAVFDPFEPHAVLKPGAAAYDGAAYEGTEPSVFLGFEVDLAPPVRQAFGIGAPIPAAPTMSSRVAIHPATGTITSAA